MAVENLPEPVLYSLVKFPYEIQGACRSVEFYPGDFPENQCAMRKNFLPNNRP